MKKTKVSHMKTADAKVKLHFRGKKIELTVVLSPDMEKQLYKRLSSTKRQGDRD